MTNGEILYGNKSRRNIILFIISIIVLTLIVLGVAFFYKDSFIKSSDDSKTKSESKTVSPTSTNSPTPIPTKTEIDKSKYSIKILNGSGIAGEAGRARKYLEDEGYEVSSVGNADEFDHKESILETEENIDEDFLSELKTFIAKKYALEDTVEASADTKNIVLIIGQTKAE
ncbi:MAG: LytR C-terminal domain-containing protein [Candidatus Levyibacteriota bacterium]